jgi:hypothetical protein
VLLNRCCSGRIIATIPHKQKLQSFAHSVGTLEQKIAFVWHGLSSQKPEQQSQEGVGLRDFLGPGYGSAYLPPKPVISVHVCSVLIYPDVAMIYFPLQNSGTVTILASLHIGKGHSLLRTSCSAKPSSIWAGRSYHFSAEKVLPNLCRFGTPHQRGLSCQEP